MSIAALQETSRELRRLAIAGSALAKDDFRLRKLVPTLQKSGEKVPILARIATSLVELMAAPDTESPRALLQATTLVHAVLHTQVQHQVDGEETPLESFGVAITSGPVAAKAIRPVIEVLTTKGGGRYDVIKKAFDEGLFRDLRLLPWRSTRSTTATRRSRTLRVPRSSPAMGLRSFRCSLHNTTPPAAPDSNACWGHSPGCWTGRSATGCSTTPSTTVARRCAKQSLA